MKIAAIIQARYGATRLPGKVLMKVAGKTMLEHVVERVKKAKSLDGAIVATTTSDKDAEVAAKAQDLGVKTFRGSENDVLDRYYQAAARYGLEHVVRITADCPLMDPKVIDHIVENYFRSRADYCSNTLEETYPDGEDVEAFGFKALERAWKEAKLPSEREHVTPYIRKNPALFKLVSVKYKEDLSSKRWTLDEPRDFDFLSSVISSLYPVKPDFGMNDVIDLLKKNPRLEDMNKGIIRNEGYLKSLEIDKKMRSGG